MSASVTTLHSFPKGERKLSMLTAYDYGFAKIVDEAGVDMILVGDSLANVVLGLQSTTEVHLEDMIHHGKAVRRAVTKALLVVDMPYSAYQIDPSCALNNARRLVEETGCELIKVEWFPECLSVVNDLRQAGLQVMGHVGLTPQRAVELGGYKVQGKQLSSAKNILEQSMALEKAGCCALVLECVPAQLAGLITDALAIPTIGIGAGPDCDGQVLVLTDLLGIQDDFHPRFLKRYAHFRPEAIKAIRGYIQDIQSHTFPGNEHSYHMSEEICKQLEILREGGDG